MADINKKKKKKKKVIKYRRPISINIGFLVFLAVFAYILIYMVMYFTRVRVSIYEVVYGKNADLTNKTYNGLLLRSEKSLRKKRRDRNFVIDTLGISYLEWGRADGTYPE